VRVWFLSDQDDLAEHMQEYTDIYEALREHDAELAKQRRSAISWQRSYLAERAETIMHTRVIELVV
jgi:hypothetical protein